MLNADPPRRFSTKSIRFANLVTYRSVSGDGGHILDELDWLKSIYRSGLMTPTDYAAEELELWQKALSDQREAEQQLDSAYRHREHQRAFALVKQLRVLRTRADLLLTEAVKVKCTFRDHTFSLVAASTTQSGDLPGCDLG